MAYRQRGQVFAIEGDTLVVRDENAGEDRIVPLGDVIEVRLWALTIESGCLLRTRSQDRFILRCGFVTEPSFMNFVIDLHVALLQGGHAPLFLRGNRLLWGSGWLLLAMMAAGCLGFSFHSPLAELAALSFWRIALLFCMLTALICFSVACIRSGRTVPYDPHELIPRRRRRLAEVRGKHFPP